MHILVLGAGGKLGSSICEVLTAQNHTFTPLERPNASGKHLELNSPLATTLAAETLSNQDVFALDVSLPEGTLGLCKELMQADPRLVQKLKGLVIGTTGHSATVQQQIGQTAKHIPVVIASNFSRGVYLFEELLKAKTSSGLPVSALARSLGFELGLIESHHSRKKDAPSGTAITLAKAAQVPEELIASLRLGSIIGEHTLVASADSEELRITHTAQNRKLFALGAVSLLKKMTQMQLQPGLYSFSEVFNMS